MTPTIGSGCDFCEGVGLVAADDAHTPWRWYVGITPERAVAVLHAVRAPIPCPMCGTLPIGGDPA